MTCLSIRPLLTALAAATALAMPAVAPLAAQDLDDIVTLEVLEGWRTHNGTHMAGLQFTLAPGWKTYWRVPGDGGIPPRFAWTGSRNLDAVAFHWPVPAVFHINAMRSIGYEGTVVLPVELAATDPSAPVRLAGQVQIGVCEEVCMPVLLEFDTILPVSADRDAAIVAALVDRPRTAAEAGVRQATCTVAPAADGLQVTASVTMPPLPGTEEVVIETADQQVWVSEPDTTRRGDTLVAQSDMIHVGGGPITLDRSQVRITVLAGAQAVTIEGCEAG